MTRFWFFALSAAALIAASAAALADSAAVSGIQIADMDTSVRPQDDLFQYANGTWLRQVQIPNDRSRYGVDSMMAEHSLGQQRELIEAARQSNDAETRKVGDLYSSFMDEQRIEEEGIKPIQAELQRIAAVNSVHDLSRLMAHFDRLGLHSPLGTFVDVDAKHSTQYALWLEQSGLGLPDRDYYLSADAKFVGFRAKYLEHIARMLALLGNTDSADAASHVLTLETALARIQWTQVANRDPQKTYNRRSIAELAQLAPAIDWNTYLAQAGVPTPLPTMLARQPDYLHGLSKLLQKTPLTTWRAYFRFRLLSSTAPYLPKAFVDENFAFNAGVLHDTPEIPARWKRACRLVDEMIGEASGKLYVAKYFPHPAKARIDDLVANLLKAYAASIEQLTWMSPATKIQALAKLRKINVKVGYPKHWRDYAKLAISPTDLMGNVLRAQEFETTRKLAQLGGPIDRDEWDMTAPTVDAYYDPNLNEIVFPTGILQLPLFNPQADDAFNYGATGAIIGHEISHGFDDEGSQFDSDGNLRDWWTPQDHAKFKAKTDKLIKEYGAFEPVPGFHVNGELTLGENIGDIAGIEIAYKAFIASLNGRAAPVIDGMTADQRFYLGYAQSWLGKQRDAATIAQLASNPHAPEEYRVNGVVVHMPSFYSAFSVASGDKMYIAPEERVTLW